ncbi:MAG: ABC transporter permease [Eggerthellaceae bacterium]|nr:ABC transporter permease [Eggerthellaceae bacterium]
MEKRRSSVIEFFDKYGALLAQGTIDTLVMSIASCVFAYVIGLPLGIWFAVTTPNGLRPNKAVNTVLGWIINIGRSIPFIILLVAIIPFTRLVVGTSLGVPGAVVPLTVAAAPFVARIVEQSLAEVDKDLIEAAHSFGASNMQIIMKVMLKESLPSLVRGVAITFVNLFGYSAMAGTVGAGGLGDIAIRYGYQRFQGDVMLAAVILCVVLVQVFQTFGDWLARTIDKR